MATDGPPAKNVASAPPAISWTSVWWATTGKQGHSVVAHRSVTAWEVGLYVCI